MNERLMDDWAIQKLQNTVYLSAQCVAAYAEIEAMKAANSAREKEGQSPAYTEESFRAIIEKYGLHHNAIMTQFQTGL